MSLFISSSLTVVSLIQYEGTSASSYIKSIVIPDSVTSIGEYAFWVCDSLTSVVIGDSVTSIGYDTFAEN